MVKREERAAIEEAIRRTTEAFPLSGIDRRTESQPIALRTVASTALRYLEPGSRVLDFGSGTGHKSAVLQCLGFQCCAVDNLQDAQPGEAEQILAFNREFGVDFRLAEEQNSGGDGKVFLPFEAGSFDMVMLHHVIEHFHDSPREPLNDLLELTKRGGVLFVTVPNAGNIRKRLYLLFGKTNMPPFGGFYWDAGPWTGHIREYVRGDLQQLAQFTGLETLELRGVDDLAAVARYPTIVRYGYGLATGVVRNWKDTWLFVGRKGDNWRPQRSQPGGQQVL